MKKNYLLGLLLPLLLSPGCDKKPSADLPPTLVWHKNQDHIRPAGGTMNVWQGFSIKADHFSADADISQFILWRRQPGLMPVFIEYSLQGRKVEISLNVREKRTLPPSRAFKREKFFFKFDAGFNFLRFRRKSKDLLQIRSLDVGQAADKSEPHLRGNESFSVFLRPGSGRIVLDGRGSVTVTEQTMAKEPPPAKVKTIHSGFLSGKIHYEFSFTQPTTVTMAVRKGQFNIRSFSRVETPAPPPAAAPRLQGKPDIYIVLSDACQPAHLGVYGYARNTSPHIDAFAADAMVYENAYANASFTRSSVATLLTGLYPDSHDVRVLANKIPRTLLTMPEYLNAKGYQTGIITSTFAVSPHFGFTQGVDDYIAVSTKRYADQDDSIHKRFTAWLDRAARPHFSYMHFLHPHLPKVPPADFQIPFSPEKKPLSPERMMELMNKAKDYATPIGRADLEEMIFAYDSSISWVDGEFGKIISRLKHKNLYDDSLIIFLADHGEAMMEHGVLAHGSNVYDEASRVPLIIKYPRAMGLKGRFKQVCELADIFPTVSGLFGQEIGMDGRNLLQRRPGRDYDDTMAVSRTFNISGVYGLRWQNWYYIISSGDNHEQLFQLEGDPLRDVGRRYPQVRNYFKARFLDWYGRFRNKKDFSVEMNLKKLPAGEIEEMKTLGYL
jgi:arylsulfatase A-like enzyme